jgi:acyl-CoA thioesterase FadM
MQLLDEAPVLESEIDSLGHMNVRYYLGRVDRANELLLSKLGIQATQTDTAVRNVDTYSRFHREQFAGASLQVVGGILDMNSSFVRCYFEIRNPAKDQVAATFITESRLVNLLNDEVLPLANEAERTAGVNVGVNEQFGVILPEHGRPRSLSLDPPRLDVQLAELESRIGDEPTSGMMGGRREATIMDEDCDEHGRLREDVDLMFVMHKSQQQEGEQAKSFGPPVMKTNEGHRFSWAMIETRALVFGRPSAGDQLVSIGADVAYGERWRQSRRWAFVQQSGRLIGINDTVGIALDLDERRSIAIPNSIREAITENNYHPDLR